MKDNFLFRLVSKEFVCIKRLAYAVQAMKLVEYGDAVYIVPRVEVGLHRLGESCNAILW